MGMEREPTIQSLKAGLSKRSSMSNWSFLPTGTSGHPDRIYEEVGSHHWIQCYARDAIYIRETRHSSHSEFKTQISLGHRGPHKYKFHCACVPGRVRMETRGDLVLYSVKKGLGNAIFVPQTSNARPQG